MAPFTSSLLVLVLLPSLFWDPTPASAQQWPTLSGKAPVVIANGGTSGLYPGQTMAAYSDAINYSLPGVVLSCDLQMSKSLNPQFLSSGTGICRTNLDLGNSTTINILAPELNNTYIVDGVKTLGWFAIDIPYENLTGVAWATQSNLGRTPVYDGGFPILKPEELAVIVNNTRSTWWLNSEYTSFIEKNSKFNATAYLQAAIAQLSPRYVSVTEINLLKKLQAAANLTGCKLVYKFLDTASLDASTNQTYVSLLQNLTYIKTLASGILVPKKYIWPIDQTTKYLQAPTTLVEDAHKAKLEVYAYNFANDQYPNSYNFSFDPITEILYFIESYNFSVDGIFSDFPTTASEAIGCYALNSRNSSLQNKEAILPKQKVISHNGASGTYPGATIAAYRGAIDAGVDYIDCIVQISNDSIPFCRSTVNLLDTTNAANTLFQQYIASYPGFNQDKRGIYPFDLTWDQISTLNSTWYSGIPDIDRDPHYDGLFPIITLAEFLSIAKNYSVGALIDIQNAVYLRDERNLAIVDAVVKILSEAGYNNTDDVILQSKDSSVLSRLRDLNVTYPLMYQVIWTTSESPVSLDSNDFVEIRKYASSVNLYVRLVEPLDSNFFLMPTNLIELAHAQNLTTYFQLQRNEFTAFAFDYRADPALQLYSLIHYGIDGIVTDYPATVVKYLDNQCIGNGLTSSLVNFSIPLVVPGDLGSQTYFAPSPTPAPAPDLTVSEPPLAGVTSVPTQEAPAPLPSAASHISTCLLLAIFSVVLHLLPEL